MLDCGLQPSGEQLCLFWCCGPLTSAHAVVFHMFGQSCPDSIVRFYNSIGRFYNSIGRFSNNE